jgi:GntR family transcriptional regulator, rspAB operon transcriptional repressor
MRGFSPWADPTASRASASVRAYDEIRRMILHGELAPGSLIAEEQLAAELGISRTPLREALHALLREGLVREAPRRQLTVTTVTRDRLTEVLDLRDTLEQFATRRAAATLDIEGIDVLRLNLIQQRRAARAGQTERYLDLDDEFHVRIAAHNNLGLTTEFLAQLRSYIRIALLGAGPADQEWDPLTATDQHEAILDALEQGNADGAAALMAAHLANTRRILETTEQPRVWQRA